MTGGPRGNHGFPRDGEGPAFWVIDLGSTNGIDVNGRRRQRAKLEDGDRLTIGTSELVFSLERP